ncbi:MAG TPA: ATP-binding protein [Candidatus Eisenbacteria bacterium]|nr:ATP-binding protein [Candidatus Eisenbacteria bacterium]
METFPSGPRASVAVRLTALAIGLIGLAVAIRTTTTSLAWIDQPFPGFFLLANRVVPSIGLRHWSASTIPGLYQSEVLAVDGVRVTSARDVYDRARVPPVGHGVRYLVSRNGVEREVVIATQRFTVRDWLLLFGAYLLDAVVYLLCGLVAWVLRPSSRLSRAFLAFGAAYSAFFLTAMDIYGPWTFMRIHTVIEAVTPAAALQLFMLFPQDHPWARWRFLGYVGSLFLAVAYQLFFHQPTAFSTVLVLNMLFLGSAGLFFGWRLISEYRGASSQLARQRVRILTVGTLLGLAIPGGALVVSSIVWGQMSMNVAVFTPVLFALSLAYAIVKHDVLEIDAMLKRGAFYLLMTGAVGAAYVGAVVLFNSILSANVVTNSPLFPLLFTLAVLLVFNPARTRIQAVVDRLFFRTRYDSTEVLARLGSDLGTAHDYRRIADVVCDHVQRAIPNAATRLFTAGPDGVLAAVGEQVRLGATLAQHLATRRIVTAFDSPESYPDEATYAAIRDALGANGAEIAVPLDHDGTLVGALTLAPKRSGLFYTAGDADFLRAVAHQAVIALENARSYQALADLNARLEDRVRERTAQLEEANAELNRAYGELQTAQVQLVQSEKMASLGRLVAGVAHEINNPVSFIASSVAPLRRRIAQAATLAPDEVRKLLADAEEITAVMARGAERTAAIVKDLRTFSRVGEATRKPVDLVDAIEVSLRLLSPRWRDRITVHRDLAPLPLIEGDPGQLNQVLVNLLANACDAIAGSGNIWVSTAVDGDAATITIRDDGAGMSDEVRQRIFEPFFTTKDVGAGTGLGLAISYNVVVDHGGRIDVESAPGRGTTVRVVLPLGAAPPLAAQATSS